MSWNWQQADWPHFTYDEQALASPENQFLLRSGEFIGAYRHIPKDNRDMLRIELIGDEALKTSAIEGEFLNCDSLQSSLRRQFGLGDDEDNRYVSAKERGIAEMMVTLYHAFAEPLDAVQLLAWHKMVMAGERHIDAIAGYRTHAEPTQVASGSVGKPKIHFETPPSSQVPEKMTRFIDWFNDTVPHGRNTLPPLTRSGLAHIYFESIHPFEDGNGRIGRALSEKALAQGIGQPSSVGVRPHGLIAADLTRSSFRKRFRAIWFGSTVTVRCYGRSRGKRPSAKMYCEGQCRITKYPLHALFA